jgi:hypothetical protein
MGLAASIPIIHPDSLPNCIVPRQIRDTFTPADPSRAYSMEDFQSNRCLKSNLKTAVWISDRK